MIFLLESFYCQTSYFLYPYIKITKKFTRKCGSKVIKIDNTFIERLSFTFLPAPKHPKFQILFDVNSSLHDLYTMTFIKPLSFQGEPLLWHLKQKFNSTDMYFWMAFEIIDLTSWKMSVDLKNIVTNEKNK